jgi:hypothetical protein
MPPPLARALLWLFVINLGVAFGAGLYEHRIVVPRWLVSARDGLHWNADAVRLDDTGLRFWAFVTTGPLTLLTLGNLWAAWRGATGLLRRWWLSAAVLALLDRVFTFAYFIPTMIGLMSAPDSASAVAEATRWWNLNYVRHALVLAAWLCALNAFALLYRGWSDRKE